MVSDGVLRVGVSASSSPSPASLFLPGSERTKTIQRLLGEGPGAESCSAERGMASSIAADRGLPSAFDQWGKLSQKVAAVETLLDFGASSENGKKSYVKFIKTAKKVGIRAQIIARLEPCR